MNAGPGAGSLQTRILQLLVAVAPDIDPATVRPDVAFRDQFDFDSMDLLNFAATIHRHFGIDVPERDYRRLASVEECAAYLQERIPAPP